MATSIAEATKNIDKKYHKIITTITIKTTKATITTSTMKATTTTVIATITEVVTGQQRIKS